MDVVSSGKTFLESEERFYGYIIAPSLLKPYAYMDIEQWMIKVKDSEAVIGKYIQRARKTVKDGKTVYTTCMKIGSVSNERYCLEDEFNFMKNSFREGQVKRRYIIPIPNLPIYWELDLFYNKEDNDQSFYKHCVLELETKGYKGELPEFPDMFKLLYKEDPNNKKIWELYDKCFIRKK